MRLRLSLVLSLTALSPIAGCGTLNNAVGLGQLNNGAGEIITLSPDSKKPAQISAFLESRNVGETLTRVSQREGHEIWRGSSGDTVTLREGVVVGTRALTPDLFSVDSAFPSQWRAAPRPATESRVHRYVDGDEKVYLRGFQCEFSRPVSDPVRSAGRSLAASRTDENCYNATLSFTNSYWLDGSGRMVRSRQWLGPELGYLRLIHVLP